MLIYFCQIDIICLDSPSPIWLLYERGNRETEKFEMDTFEVGDKVVYESDLTAVKVEISNIGSDVDDLSTQLRELREELHKRGVA
jgi:hypothetical protein